jgi:hypothetical protein
MDQYYNMAHNMAHFGPTVTYKTFRPLTIKKTTKIRGLLKLDSIYSVDSVDLKDTHLLKVRGRQYQFFFFWP